MKICSYAMLVLLLPWFSLAAQTFDDSKIKHIEYPGWFTTNEFQDLSEVLSASVAERKQGLMVFFSTEGCSYCDRFIRTSLQDPQLQKTLRSHFTVVGLEVFDDTEMTDPAGQSMSIKAFAARHRTEFTPTLLFFDSNGKRILRVTGYQSPERFKVVLDYLVGKHYLGTSLREYRVALKSNQSPAQKPAVTADRRPDNAAIDLNRGQLSLTRPLLVLFEKPGCTQCRALNEDVLALPEIRQQLASFDIVRLNAGDHRQRITLPDGVKTTPAAWFDAAGFTHLPALLFFNESGKEVLKTDAIVKRQRMLNSMSFVLERAYDKGWSYQRHARSKGIQRLLKSDAEQP